VARCGDKKCRVFAERYPLRDVGSREDVGPAGGGEEAEDGEDEEGGGMDVIHFYHEADYPNRSPFYV
jgi:hypothetical protein